MCSDFLNIGFSLVFPFLPLHLKQLGSSPFLIGQVTLAAFAGKLLLQLPGGILVDRKGPYPIAFFILLIQILCYFLMAFMTHPYAFLVIRFVMGGAEAIGNTALLVLLTLRVPKEKMGGMMGMYTMACTLALALGPILGGWLYDLTGSAFHSMLYAAFVSCLALVMLLLLGLLRKSFQLKGEIKKKEKVHLKDQLHILRQPNYLLPLWTLAGTNIISQVIYSYITTFMPIYLKDELHFKSSAIGLLFTLNFIIFTFAVPLFGKIVDRYIPSQRSIILAFWMLLSGFFSLGLVTDEILFFVVSKHFLFTRWNDWAGIRRNDLRCITQRGVFYICVAWFRRFYSPRFSFIL